ncbi:DUF4279 domain-containing protein [Microbacterium testaceum]|uniref:DUF4279 domain-containing protein n=1 Tax=Microbacterium testaceum TaxID=2033 RepID=UPI003433095C
MIRGNRASLSIHSDTKTVAEISEMLGLAPDAWGDKGDLTPAGRARRNHAPERLTHQRTYWSLTERDHEPGPGNQTGFSALRALVARLEPNAQALMELRRGGETTLWWSGDSDSTQGGFVLEVDLIRCLSTLGCDLFGTAFLAEDDEIEANADVGSPA